LASQESKDRLTKTGIFEHFIELNAIRAIQW